jgi:hypothetical protein
VSDAPLAQEDGAAEVRGLVHSLSNESTLCTFSGVQSCGQRASTLTPPQGFYNEILTCGAGASVTPEICIRLQLRWRILGQLSRLHRYGLPNECGRASDTPNPNDTSTIARPLVQQREPDGCEAGLHLAGLLNGTRILYYGPHTTCLDPRARTRKQVSARESQQGISLAGMYQRIKFPDQGLLERLISIL